MGGGQTAQADDRPAGTLTVPADLVGTVQDVRQRVQPRVEHFLAGGPWAPVSALEVDLRDVDGLVVLSGPAPALGGRSHVQAFVPLDLLVTHIAADRVPPEREETAVAASLTTPWGLLGLVSPPNLLLVLPPDRHRPIIAAALRYWDLLDGIGARYTVGADVGERLWDQPTGLLHVLGRLGVPEKVLTAPRDPRGLPAVVPAALRSSLRARRSIPR